MALSQSNISEVLAEPDGADILITWASTDPGYSTYQVYINRRLTWHGTDLKCLIPQPSGLIGSDIWIEVGTVAPEEAALDLSASLASPEGAMTQAQLAWIGGTYLDPLGRGDVASFQVYASAAAGQPVSLGNPIAAVPAYPGGWISDGFGMGGFGQGGFGQAASSYTWLSGPLSGGMWQFGVAACGAAGNAQAPSAFVSVAIQAAPAPPAIDPDGKRLSYTYDGQATRRVSLNWQPSPS